MNRRYIYPILIILVTVGLYYLEGYVNNTQQETPTEPKEDTIKVSVEPYKDFEHWYLPRSSKREYASHDYFSLSYNEEHEQARWVAYNLSAEQIVDNNFDRPYFEQDPQIRTGSAHWRNYKNSGYDRGHLVPAADMEFDYQVYKSTFLTSNVSPQLHEFNSGVWNYLEQRVRRWAKENDGVFVLTGGVLKDPIGTIGSEEVSVPSAFYKIILDNYRDEYRVIAFLIPHEKDPGSYKDYIVTVNEIEAATGIDFFNNAPKELEEDLESRIDRLYFDIN